MEKGWKNRRKEKIIISLLCVSWEWKSGGMKKVSLYKFTYMSLLKK